jgi:DNA-binding beta-propeller fold protein YncE
VKTSSGIFWYKLLTVSNPDSSIHSTTQLIRRLRQFFNLHSSIFMLSIFIPLALSCTRRAAPPAPFLAFVVCQDSSSVAVVDLAELRVVASLKVSNHPEAAVARPGSREIYITGPGGLDRIEGPGFKVYLNSRTDHHPRSLVFSRDGRFAYYLMEPEPLRPAVSGALSQPPQPGVSHISIFDCEAKKEVGQIGLRASLSRLTLTADGKTLVATDPVAGMVHFFDVAARKALGTVNAGPGAGPIAVQSFGSKVFVSNTTARSISVVDAGARQLFSHIELGAQPGALLLKPDGGELFVLSPESSTLTILDAFHDNVLQILTAGRNPVAGVFRRDSSVLYLASAGDGSVMALDVVNRLVLGSTFVGREPRALALTPDERFLAVADAGTSSLAVLIAEPSRLAATRSALLTSLSVGAKPVDVVIPDSPVKDLAIK